MVPVWLAVLLLALLRVGGRRPPALYATRGRTGAAAEAINASPGIVALYGPILDVHSLGELAMTKMTVLYAVFVAIMMLFVVRRHTRLDEENGQAELIGGTAITSTRPLDAAIAFGAAVAVAARPAHRRGRTSRRASARRLAGVRRRPGPGSAWSAVGITAVACQVSASARTCAAIASGAIGVLFVLRAVGDTTTASWLSWLTPVRLEHPAARVRRHPLVGAAPVRRPRLGLVGSPGSLRDRRDLGAGMVAPRPGPATGSPRLADAIALSLRVHTPMLVGWTVGDGRDWARLRRDLAQLRRLSTPAASRTCCSGSAAPGAFRDVLLGAVISVLSLVVTCFAIAVVSHGGSDEHDGRTEQVLATATSRTRASWPRRSWRSAAPPGCCWSPASRSRSASAATRTTRSAGWSPRRWPRRRPCGW